jgi:hypothetical protein
MRGPSFGPLIDDNKLRVAIKLQGLQQKRKKIMCVFLTTMRRLQLLLAVMICFQATTAMGDLFVPSGLSPGDEYRLAFVTDTNPNRVDATSSDIAVYNAFVQSQAELSVLTAGVDWFAIASTATVDAIDNVGVSTAPIYLVNDTLLENDATDLWDGTIQNEFRINQFGDEEGTDDVWTGTGIDGKAYLGGAEALGTDTPRVGRTSVTNNDWVSFGNRLNTDIDVSKFYAVSQTLTVVPEPSSLGLCTLALGALVGFARRRRR